MRNPIVPSGRGVDSQKRIAALAKKLNDVHSDGINLARTSLEYFRKAGELLTQIKDELNHGEFENWVEQNCPFTLWTARAYMRIYNCWNEIMAAITEGETPTLRGALNLIAEPKSTEEPAEPPYESVLGVNVDDVVADRRKQEDIIARGKDAFAQRCKALRDMKVLFGPNRIALYEQHLKEDLGLTPAQAESYIVLADHPTPLAAFVMVD